MHIFTCFGEMIEVDEIVKMSVNDIFVYVEYNIWNGIEKGVKITHNAWELWNIKQRMSQTSMTLFWPFIVSKYEYAMTIIYYNWTVSYKLLLWAFLRNTNSLNISWSQSFYEYRIVNNQRTHFLLCRTLQSHHWNDIVVAYLTILDSWAYSLTLFGCKLTPECQNWSSKFSSWHYLAGRCKFVSLLPAFVQTPEPHLRQRCQCTEYSRLSGLEDSSSYRRKVHRKMSI